MQILCFNPSQATRRHSQICVACPTCQGKRIQYVSDVSARHSTQEDSAKRCKAQEMLFNASSAQDRSTSKASLVLAQFCRKLPKGLDARVCTAAAAAAAAAVSLASNLTASLSLFTYFDISHSSLLYRSTCTLVNTAKCILPWGLVAYTILKGMMRRRKIDAMTGLAILDPLSVQST